MGDLNTNIQNETLMSTKWKHVTELHDLHQLIDESTRITAHSETLLDNLYVSSPDKVTEVSVPKIATSDHYPICFTRCSSKCQLKRNDHKEIQYRCFKVDWTFESLWDPLLTISPNLFFFLKN